MSAVPFHCPLCDGLFQVDDSLAGIEVNCPHCQGLVTVPEVAGPPAPPMSPAMELSCPLCSGPFQVLAEFAGQQVHCPHCQQIVTVPETVGYDERGITTPPLVPPADRPPTPIAPILAQLPPAADFQRAADVKDLSSERFPPRQSVDSPAPINPQDLYPPGYQPTVRRATQLRPVPPQANAPADPLLPPDTGAATSKPRATTELLPPGATAATPVPAERMPLPVPTQARKEGSIPTERGSAGVSKSVKTVQHHGDEVELRKLTPEEKGRRRLVRNTILFVFCMITLIVVMALFMWK